MPRGPVAVAGRPTFKADTRPLPVIAVPMPGALRV